MKLDAEILDARYWLLDTPILCNIKHRVSSIVSNSD